MLNWGGSLTPDKSIYRVNLQLDNDSFPPIKDHVWLDNRWSLVMLLMWFHSTKKTPSDMTFYLFFFSDTPSTSTLMSVKWNVSAHPTNFKQPLTEINVRADEPDTIRTPCFRVRGRKSRYPPLHCPCHRSHHCHRAFGLHLMDKAPHFWVSIY